RRQFDPARTALAQSALLARAVAESAGDPVRPRTPDSRLAGRARRLSAHPRGRLVGPGTARRSSRATGRASMKTLSDLLAGNRAWAAGILRDDPDFFRRLAQQQGPRYLWIGCSDSRVPANQIVGLLPGEMFVHRNVANLVVHTDLNCLSALQFAVDVLQVEQIIVCGHYGCGGVLGVLRGERLGLVDNWLRHVQDVREAHREVLDALDT